MANKPIRLIEKAAFKVVQFVNSVLIYSDSRLNKVHFSFANKFGTKSYRKITGIPKPQNNRHSKAAK